MATTELELHVAELRSAKRGAMPRGQRLDAAEKACQSAIKRKQKAEETFDEARDALGAAEEDLESAEAELVAAREGIGEDEEGDEQDSNVWSEAVSTIDERQEERSRMDADADGGAGGPPVPAPARGHPDNKARDCRVGGMSWQRGDPAGSTARSPVPNTPLPRGAPCSPTGHGAARLSCLPGDSAVAEVDTSTKETVVDTPGSPTEPLGESVEEPQAKRARLDEALLAAAEEGEKSAGGIASAR